ncbi:MAG: xanthine dehydrogenase accessory protein XdhC [Acuticoccus sp.]
MSEATLAALRAAAARGPAIVALLETVSGSTPREVGAWMIVTADGALGTIGGGEAERRTIEAARQLLAGGGAPQRLALPLGPALDQCCGGHMTVALAIAPEVAAAATDDALALWPGGPAIRDRPLAPVVVYGAGHVGCALVTALSPLPFALTFVDARAEALWPVAAPVPCHRLALPETAAAAAPDDAIHLVMTHSHAVDLEIVAAVLARPFRFCGLIGSATKRATFERRLRERGLDTARLTCPIGLPAIAGKAPAVIAASVAAQLLALAQQPG